MLVRLATWFALSTAGLGFAQACLPTPADTFKSTLPGLGVAYFGDFRGSLQAAEARLLGGVCIAGESGWELRSETLRISGFGGEGPVDLVAESATLTLADWTLQASVLALRGESVTLAEVAFHSADITGRARSGRFELGGGNVALEGVVAEGESFRIQGEAATLAGATLVFEDAVATTCVCEGGSLYVIRAPSASYDTAAELVTVRNGQLEIGALRLQLRDFELGPDSLADLTFPIVVEYIRDDEAAGVQGTGLGIRIPNLRVDDELSLELGVSGIDRDYPFVGVLVARYRGNGVRFDIGRASQGFQADFALREPLAPWLDATFAVNNRDWRGADFLHEGKLGLQAEQAFNVGGHRLELDGGSFAAASSQTLRSGQVSSSRLGVYATAAYRSPDTPLGRFSARLRTETTHYAEADATQYGVSFAPTWRETFGPVDLRLGWSYVATNAASPFAKSLDRLSAKNELSLQVKASGPLAQNSVGNVDFRVRYDFANPVLTGRFGEQLDLFRLSGGLSWQRPEFEVKPFIDINLAPVLNSGLNSSDAYIEGGFDLDAERWEAGFALRFDPSTQNPLEKLELRGTFPIDIGEVTLQPFVALDLLPTLQANVLPRVSGQGLELTWKSCCGTIVVAYKQVENTFSTTFAVRFDE